MHVNVWFHVKLREARKVALGSFVESMKTAYGEWKSKKISSKVLNAAASRIHNGSLLNWIQQQAPSIVGVVQVGHEELARCIAVGDVDLDGPVPFIDPTDMRSLDSLQMSGCILFIVTFLGTSMLCLVGHSRSKQAEEWSAEIGDESAVDAFLNLSAQFLPPECLNQREEGAATLVTMPANA